jgi:hypothetical protein
MTGNNLFLTNVLLTIIAALLLVNVIQNGMGSSGNVPRPQLASEGYHPGYGGGASSQSPNPTVNPGAQQMAGKMYFMAMTGFPEGCKGVQTLDQCDSPAAQAVKAKVNSIAEGKRPREVFDIIIKTYGENALTDQAKAIRNMRVKGQ